MANIMFLNQPFESVGLTPFTYTVVPTLTNPAGAGLYNVQCQASVPSAVATGDGAGSGGNLSMGPAISSSVSIVVNQNGSPVYTSEALSPTQLAVQFKFGLNCANGDVITVVPASSNPVDNLLNTVKMAVAIRNGL
jgi:hypothetical protein